jgi:hypothetical protein
MNWIQFNAKRGHLFRQPLLEIKLKFENFLIESYLTTVRRFVATPFLVLMRTM